MGPTVCRPYLSLGELADLLSVQSWRIGRLFELGLLPEPDRVAGRRMIPKAMVPQVIDGLRGARLAASRGGNAVMKSGKKPTNGSSTIKRPRRSRVEMNGIRDALVDLLTAENPMTVRQAFYRAVSSGIVEKTEAQYKGTIGRLLCELRRDRQIPFEWIADNTRWMRKPKTYDCKEDMLRLTAQTYRRALWNDQDAYVEVWLEKEALAGVVVEVTAKWDVPLMVTRGYPSLSYIHSAAEAISSQGKPAFLYYFGDHDPSGVDIPRTVDVGLRKLAPDAEIEFDARCSQSRADRRTRSADSTHEED